MNNYGKQFSSEQLASEKLDCRKILTEIKNFGVSNRQKLFLIYLLSLELDEVFLMREISGLVRKNANELFLIDKAEEENGKSSKQIILE